MVLVEAAVVPSQSAAEAAWLVRQLGQAPGVVVASLMIEAGGAATREALDQLTALGRVTGVRRLLQDEAPSFFDSDLVGDSLRHLAAAGFSFDACVRHWQLPYLIRLLRAHEDLRVVVDHLAKPPINSGPSSEEADAWRRNVGRLAALPNVYMKISGLHAEVEHPLDLVETRPWISFVLDAFGPQRTMVGSDWGVSISPTNGERYGEWFRWVELQAGPAAMADVMRETAVSFYRIPVAAFESSTN